MTEASVNYQQCTRCKKLFSRLDFKKSNGTEYKYCIQCRVKNREVKRIKRNKCLHGRERYYCKECKGNGICMHNKARNQCKQCKGNGICIHNKTKYHCKLCKESSISKRDETNRSQDIIHEYNMANIECYNNSIYEYDDEFICEHSQFKSACCECNFYSL